MDDWYVNVLISIRDVAAKNGLVALAEEMDVAILIASNEVHEREMTDLGVVNVDVAEPNPRPAVGSPGPDQLQRYH